jgi:HEAT repeat protein
MRTHRLILGAFCLLCWSAAARAQDLDPNDIGDVDSTDLDTGLLQQSILDSLDQTETVDSLDLQNAISNIDVSGLVDPADVAANLEGLEPPRERRRNLQDATQLLYSPAARRRAAAARSIGNRKNVLEVSALVGALSDRSAQVRRAAAQSLAKVGDFESLGAMKRALGRERDPQAQRAIDKAIGAIEDRLFSAPGSGTPVTLTCPDGRKFILLRKVPRGYCPYDGTAWTLK